jgi:hypothetical protein
MECISSWYDILLFGGEDGGDVDVGKDEVRGGSFTSKGHLSSSALEVDGRCGCSSVRDFLYVDTDDSILAVVVEQEEL